MRGHAGRTTSVWMTHTGRRDREPVRDDATADVCVVGGGIAGLTTAYLLGREGLRVLLVDDGPLAAGETERTTAHLSNEMDDRYVVLEQVHGEEGARLAAESHAWAIDLIERTVESEGIDCDFERVDGYLFNAPGQPADLLDRELAAAHRAGLNGVEMIARAPLEGFDTGPALRFPRQGQFHPLKYLDRLAQRIEAAGGRLHAWSHAERIVGGPGAHVTVAGGATVSCSAIVVATNSPVNDLFAIHTKQAPYRTYVIGVRVPRGSVHRALYWDTLDAYHYVRLQSAEDHDVLIVGGEDHKTGQAADYFDRFTRLERWTRERFPRAGTVDFRWSGQVMEPVDGVAFIGRNPMDADNVYIITGDSGQGMTHGTLGAALVTDLIMGRENPWAKLYDPSRKPLRSLKEYARENLNAAAQYADHLKPGDAATTDQIAPGAGALVRDGARIRACFRDVSGHLHECSAVCTHLGGVVQWNPVERTWDCPLHGSRFAPTGEVLNGPAISRLGPVETRARGKPIPGRREAQTLHPADEPRPPAPLPEEAERQE